MSVDGPGEAPGRAPAPLAHRIRRLIALGGPLSLSEYMRIALLDPVGGYYATAEPFGSTGDFTTAPEISQLFGEILGAALIDLWQRMGAPAGTRLMELGPGRGTLMADILRVAARVPGFLGGPGAGIDLVEASGRLRSEQAGRLAAHADRITWHERLPEPTCDGPVLVIANEFFDALPIRQFVREGEGFRERLVGVDGSNALALLLGPRVPLPTEAAGISGELPDGAVIEVRPEADALMRTLAGRIVRFGGALIAIDYGYAEPPLTSTFQAVGAHQSTDPLLAPGTVDLTAHVDFSALARAARAEGALVHGPITQGDFLIALGLLERAGKLGADKPEPVRAEIRAAVERLAGPDAMGSLFKVLAITGDQVLPAGFPDTATGVA